MAAGTKLGTAWIDVDANLSPFWRKLNAELSGVNTKSIGKSLGKSLADNLSVGDAIEKDLRRAGAQVARVADDTGQKIADGLLRGLKDAKTEINAFARDGSASLNAMRRVGADVTGSLEAPIKKIAKVNLFARDGAASFTSLGKAARGAGAEVTGSFDPASKALQRVDADITGAVEHVGKALRGVSSDATGGFDTAVRKINLFGRDGVASFSDVGNSARHGNAEIKALYAGITHSNISRALGGIGKAAITAGEDIEHGVKRGSDAVRNLSRASNSGGGGVGRSIGAIGDQLPGGVAAIGGLRIALALVVPALIAFGGASVAAASALVPLIGLAASAGSVLAAAAQGLGVLKLATTGIGAALKEQTTNQEQSGAAAATAAGQQRSAARAISGAQEGVRKALEGVTSAEDDLKDAQRDARVAQKGLNAVRAGARRALADMRTALTDAVLSEKDAVLGIKDAQQALAALATTASQHEISVAIQDVTEALHGQAAAALSLLHAQQDLNDLINKSAADANRQATAAAALARAQQNLAQVSADQNATFDERSHALALVADAQKAVNDANDAATVTELDKADALLAVTSAQDGIVDAQNRAIDSQKALSDLQNGPSDLDKQHAILDLAKAVQSLIETQRDAARQAKDLAAADKLGVEGSKDVVDAKAAIAEANKRVDDAEKSLQDAHRQVTQATTALSDAQLSANEALVKGTAATQNLNKAFDALPPAAQTFVRALIAMKPRLDELRQTAAQGFFPGATKGLQAAMGSFGAVNKVIGQTARVLGEAARKSGELVGSPAFGKDLETIGGRNAKVIDTLGEALRHVISALRNVLVAAGPLTQWLADVADKWALNAAEAAKAGRESGKLAKFFEKTRAICERLGSIIGHLTGGLIGIGKAGTKSGNDIWNSIDKAAARFEKWANSAKGQKDLHDFFTETKDLAAAIVPILGGVADAVAFLTLKAVPLSEILKVLGPYADEATVAFIGYKFATIGVAAVTKGATAAMIAYKFALRGTYTAFWLLEAAMATTLGPIALVVAGIAAAAAVFYLAYTKIGWFHKAVNAVFNFIKDHWPLLLAILTGPFGLAVYEIVKHWDAIKDAVSDGISAVLRALKDAGHSFIQAGKDIINQIVSGIKTAGGALASVGGWLKDRVTEFITGAKDGFVSVGGTIIGFIVDGLKGGLNLLIDFLNEVIEKINLIPGVDIDAIKHVKVKTDGKARGGAYARTGGVVSSPITLMGEEAPQYPEWVIPTNPAYRKRALALLMQAAQSIGLAKGGIYSQGDMEDLWARHGGGDKKIAGAVGMAESHGDPNAANGPYHGLWQIGPNGPFDPDQNAAAGVAKWRASGWAPWEAYTGPDGVGSDGPWRQFAGGGGGILSKIGGVIGGLLSKGANLILGKLPGVGKLPDWIKGAGSYVLEHAAKWIKDKVSGIIGLGGGGGTVNGGVTGSVKGAMELARSMGLSITSTTGGEHAENSWHYKGRAADVAGSPAQMGAFFNAALAKYGSHLLELFYDPLGAVKNGARIPAVGGHSDHVHIALAKGGVFGPHQGSFAQGGIVGGAYGAPATITAHGGEAVVPDGARLIGALNEHSAELRALRQAGISGVMASITDHVLRHGGDESHRRRMTAGNPAVTAIYT